MFKQDDDHSSSNQEDNIKYVTTKSPVLHENKLCGESQNRAGSGGYPVNDWDLMGTQQRLKVNKKVTQVTPPIDDIENANKLGQSRKFTIKRGVCKIHSIR